MIVLMQLNGCGDIPSAPQPCGGRQEVDLIFDRQYLAPRIEQAHRRIAARDIADHAHNAAMDMAMMLANLP